MDLSPQKGKAEVRGGEVAACGIPPVRGEPSVKPSFQLQAQGSFRIWGLGKKELHLGVFPAPGKAAI